MASRWTSDRIETIDSASYGIEMFYVTDNTYVEQDHLVIRQIDGDHYREIWVGADAVKPLVSALEAHRPGQLALFDQDAMP